MESDRSEALTRDMASHFHTTEDDIRRLAGNGPGNPDWVRLKQEFYRVHPQWSPAPETHGTRTQRARERETRPAFWSPERRGAVLVWLIVLVVVAASLVSVGLIVNAPVHTAGN